MAKIYERLLSTNILREKRRDSFDPLCRKAKVCMPRSLRRQTNKGKCVSLVLKACAEEQTGEVCIARCKSFLRADLHGTVFVACILKHVLKCWYKNRTV